MAPVLSLQCMALFPCNRNFPWKYSLCYALNFTNKLQVDTVITTGLLPLHYSNKPPACNIYIANIIQCRTAFFRSSRSEAVSSIKGSEMTNPVIML